MISSRNDAGLRFGDLFRVGEYNLHHPLNLREF